jgi:predicted RNA binding protein YcfA (HicA-like mRNA interferase family)
MPDYTRLPAISGKQLVQLLQKDGWIIKRRSRHGVALAKDFGDHFKVTVIPDTSAPLDDGTLGAILGVKQTTIGRKGLLDLVNKFGL